MKLNEPMWAIIGPDGNTIVEDMCPMLCDRGKRFLEEWLAARTQFLGYRGKPQKYWKGCTLQKVILTVKKD